MSVCRPRSSLLCLAGAATIVWAVLPRIDRFVPPGPELTSTEAPQLFTVLNEVAATTEQAMPAHVYLVNDVNAFVTQRGGVMGVGSKRVMGIGLPLLQSLTVQEFKAVLAHEFGHYHAGDVSIGPWIYKTRAAIGRTIEKLSDSVLQKIFVVYGQMFLRVTHAVSRRQEFIADEVAANAAGAGVMASALRKVHGAALAFPATGARRSVRSSTRVSSPRWRTDSPGSSGSKRSAPTSRRQSVVKRPKASPIPTTRIHRSASAWRRSNVSRRAATATSARPSPCWLTPAAGNDASSPSRSMRSGHARSHRSHGRRCSRPSTFRCGVAR